MNKNILIICDGMDYDYTKKHLEDLPFIKKMMENGTFRPLQSVVPADSVPSWSTIYTGLNPCEHGVLESIDYLNYKNNLQSDYSWIKGKVFWDKLSDKGEKVLVVNPFMAYPSWSVNGLMISGPVFEGGDLSISDISKIKNYKLPDMGGITDYPYHKQMSGFFSKTYQTTNDQFDLFMNLLGSENYNFGFLGILTLDRMQHFLWRYTDSTDRTYVRNTNLHDSILESYKLIDKKLNEIFEKFGKEYNLLVISDHGHGKRCENTFYINRWLIENGFIPNKTFKKRCIEYLKNSVLNFLTCIHCVEKGTRFFKKFKFLHKVKDSEYGEKNHKTKKIYAPKFDGVNPFGGIKVNRSEFASDQEYNDTIYELISKLKTVKNNQESIMEWVKRREDIYRGDKEDVYPEIIYKMKDNYGVDRGLYGKRLFGKSYFHEILSGGHRWNGVCISNMDVEIDSVTQVYDFIINRF